MNLTKKQKTLLVIVGLIAVVFVFAPGLLTWNPSSGTYIPNTPSLPGQCGQPGLQPAGCPPVGAKCFDQNFKEVPCIASTTPLQSVFNQLGFPISYIYYIWFTASLTNNGGVTLNTASLTSAINNPTGSPPVYDGDIYNKLKNNLATPVAAANIPTCTANPGSCSWLWVSSTPPCDSGEISNGTFCFVPLNGSVGAITGTNYEAQCAAVTGCQFGVTASAEYTLGQYQKTIAPQRQYKVYIVKPDPTGSFTLDITAAGQ